MVYFWKTLVLLLFLYGSSHAFTSKAIWVVRDALATKKNISEIIDNAKLLQCDKIFLQLRALGNVYYPSLLDIPQKKVDDKLLNNLFIQAQKNNIEIHVWLNVCYVWPIKNRPLAQNHVLNKVKASIIRPINPEIKPEGYFLHPNDKWNLSEVKTIMDELIGLYPISGFHLDYFRYPKEKTHTSKLGRTEFQIKFGFDPVEPLKNSQKFIQERGLESYSYFQRIYRNFLRNELTLALKDIRNFLKKKNKNIQLSVAVKPNPNIAKHHFLQNWVLWLERDLCDFVVTMNYSPEIETFMKNIEIASHKTDTSKIMIGIATYNIEAENISERIRQVKNTTYKGYVLFSYNYIKERKELFNLIKDK